MDLVTSGTPSDGATCLHGQCQHATKPIRGQAMQRGDPSELRSIEFSYRLIGKAGLIVLAAKDTLHLPALLEGADQLAASRYVESVRMGLTRICRAKPRSINRLPAARFRTGEA